MPDRPLPLLVTARIDPERPELCDRARRRHRHAVLTTCNKTGCLALHIAPHKCPSWARPDTEEEKPAPEPEVERPSDWTYASRHVSEFGWPGLAGAADYLFDFGRRVLYWDRERAKATTGPDEHRALAVELLREYRSELLRRDRSDHLPTELDRSGKLAKIQSVLDAWRDSTTTGPAADRPREAEIRVPDRESGGTPETAEPGHPSGARVLPGALVAWGEEPHRRYGIVQELRVDGAAVHELLREELRIPVTELRALECARDAGLAADLEDLEIALRTQGYEPGHPSAEPSDEALHELEWAAHKEARDMAYAESPGGIDHNIVWCAGRRALYNGRAPHGKMADCVIEWIEDAKKALAERAAEVEELKAKVGALTEPARGKVPGLHARRLAPNAGNPREVAFAEAWERESVLPLLLGDGTRRVEPTRREAEVAATIIQWLGSNVGQSFLRELGYVPTSERPGGDGG